MSQRICLSIMISNVYILILIRIWTIPSLSSLPCSYKSATIFPLQMTPNSKTSNTFHTVVNTSLRPNEKFCAELLLENSDGIHKTIPNKSDRRFLHIELAKVSQEYLIQNDYNFTVPTIAIQCNCDCPGVPDDCTKKYEDDASCEPSKAHLPSVQCFRQYSFGHSSSGCFIGVDLAGVCCSVAIYRDTTSVVYRAIYIDSPRTLYEFVIELLDGDLTVITRLNVSAASTTHGAFDFKFRDNDDKFNVSLTNKHIILEINGQSVSKLVPSMWAYWDPKTDKIMVNKALRFNWADETNLNRLGWFKVENKQNPTVHPTAARAALSVAVENCKNNKFRDDWDFDAIGWRKEGGIAELDEYEKGVPLQRFYNSLVDDVYYSNAGRKVEITPKDTIAVPFTLNLDFSVKLLVRYDESDFEKFTGVISVDEFANRLLHLTIEMAIGTILVVVGSNQTSCKETQHTIVVNSLGPIRFQRSVRISSCVAGMQLVCLYSTPTWRIRQCKMIRYVEKYFGGPKARKPVSKSEVGELDDLKSSNFWDRIKSWIENLKKNIVNGVVIPSIVCIGVLVGSVLSVWYWRKRLCGFCRESTSENGRRYFRDQREQFNLLQRQI